MSESFELKEHFNATAEEIYASWLSSEDHSEFTEGVADIKPKIGYKYSAWDNYITGVIMELEPNKRILHTWRTTDFKTNDEDSLLEILFDDDPRGGAIMTLKHTNLPSGTSDEYIQGWKDYYITPMKKYFSEI